MGCRICTDGTSSGCLWCILKSNPDIKEIATFGSAQNPALDTQAKMEAVLKQYPKGEITAVWAAWDEFAKGAARAIQQAGRTEIKVYGIDMSDEDLQMIQDPKNPWVASAAVDPNRYRARTSALCISEVAWG